MIMIIIEPFIKEILESEFPENYEDIYDKSLLIQYPSGRKEITCSIPKLVISIGEHSYF